MPASLRCLSDSVILARTLELTRRERSVTLQVLVHLQEIERRKLHLKQGHSSLFAYCTRALGYSESAANLRIRAARCLARFPQVHALLESGAVNPSTISQVSRILTQENSHDVLARIRNKSQRDVEAIVAAYEPRAALPGDRVRTVVVRVPVDAPERAAPAAATPAPETTHTWQEIHRCNSGARELPANATAVVPPCAAPADRPALLETRKVFKFTATEMFEKKFRRFKSLASHRLPPNPSFEQVFELAMDCFLEREDPLARHARREKRGKKTPGAGAPARSPRHLPARVRDRVFARDQGCCSYRGPDGTRCGSTYTLQVDHIAPVARGGGGTADNLRLLCAHHNRLEAERLLGASITRRRSAPRLQR